MITIPTSELIGGLTDVLGLAPQTKGAYLRGVLIEWTGDSLSFGAFDTLSGGLSTWVPGDGDESEIDEESDPDDIHWGGDDAPFRVFIHYDDAKEIVKVFKLASKFWRVPVSIKVNATGSRLIVERSRDTGRRESLVMVPTDDDWAAKFPDIRQIVLESLRGVYVATTGMSYSGARLAAFGAVRAHGVTQMVFGDDSTATAIRLGTRFVGFIYPSGAKPAAVRTNDLLRTGSGLFVSDRAEQESRNPVNGPADDADAVYDSDDGA